MMKWDGSHGARIDFRTTFTDLDMRGSTVSTKLARSTATAGRRTAGVLSGKPFDTRKIVDALRYFLVRGLTASIGNSPPTVARLAVEGQEEMLITSRPTPPAALLSFGRADGDTFLIDVGAASASGGVPRSRGRPSFAAQSQTGSKH